MRGKTQCSNMAHRKKERNSEKPPNHLFLVHTTAAIKQDDILVK